MSYVMNRAPGDCLIEQVIVAVISQAQTRKMRISLESSMLRKDT